jgi:hypothetical protein
MSSTLKFNRRYFVLAMLILAAEICIALFAHDRIIRPYVGDFLVVILMYCFLKSFLGLPVLITALSVLLFSYAVEISQYFKFSEKLGLKRSHLAKIILGSSFEWADLIVYTAAFFTILFIEQRFNRKTRGKVNMKPVEEFNISKI